MHLGLLSLKSNANLPIFILLSPNTQVCANFMTYLGLLTAILNFAAILNCFGWVYT